MKTVQKGNKQLRVADDRLKDMLNRGYVEVDDKGKPVAKVTKDDAKALKEENKALKEENKELKKANKELTEKVEALTKQLEELAAPADQ